MRGQLREQRLLRLEQLARLELGRLLARGREVRQAADGQRGA